MPNRIIGVIHPKFWTLAAGARTVAADVDHSEAPASTRGDKIVNLHAPTRFSNAPIISGQNAASAAPTK